MVLTININLTLFSRELRGSINYGINDHPLFVSPAESAFIVVCVSF